MTENWTDELKYTFVGVEQVPPHVQRMTKQCYDFVNHLYEDHDPGDVMAAFMNTTVAIALNNADYHEVPRSEVMKMMVHFFMDAMKNVCPDQVQ